jgi:hypothetical protein
VARGWKVFLAAFDWRSDKLTSAQMTLLLGGIDYRRHEEHAIKMPEMAG